MAERPSASSTQEGSYFVFFMVAPQAGQLGVGFWQEAPHAEQMYSSARKRPVKIYSVRFVRDLIAIRPARRAPLRTTFFTVSSALQ